MKKSNALMLGGVALILVFGFMYATDRNILPSGSETPNKTPSETAREIQRETQKEATVVIVRSNEGYDPSNIILFCS